MIDLNKPLWQLTAGEFLELLKQDHTPEPTKQIDTTEKDYVYGIAGIAQLFGCCNKTASKIFHSGKIDKAVSRWGQKIIVDAVLALELNKI